MGERGASEDRAAEGAERGADGVGGVDAGEGEFPRTRTPQEFFQARIGEPFTKLLRLPELVAELWAERGVVGREIAELVGDLCEGVGGVGLERGVELRDGPQRGEELRPAFPGADERRGGVHVIELGEQRAGVAGPGGVRMRIGDSRRQVVRLVEDEQRARGVEAGLVVEEGAVARGEDIVVVADPHVVEGEGGAGDLVRADAGVAAGGADRLKVARVVFKEIKPRESALRPAFLEPVEVGADLAHAVEGVS